MGQSKSKVLDTDAGGRRLTQRRGWRKRKGYSLSASLEADLNTSEAPEAGVTRVSGGRGPREGSGPVLVSYKRGDINNLCSSHHHPLQPQQQQQQQQQQQRRSSLGAESGGYLPAAELALAEENELDDDKETQSGDHEEKLGDGDWADIIDGSQADLNNTSRPSERLKNAETPWTPGIKHQDNPLAAHHFSSSRSQTSTSGVLKSGKYNLCQIVFSHPILHSHEAQN